jgi:hypothetical protein
MKINYYAADPGYLLSYRKDIGEMIEKISKVTITGTRSNAVTENPDFTAYPNPFRDKTTIQYNLKVSGKVNVSIYNMAGQLVDVLINGFQPVGIHQLEYFPKQSGNSKILNGLYICKISFNGLVKTMKMVACP